jgi:TonB family protein
MASSVKTKLNILAALTALLLLASCATVEPGGANIEPPVPKGGWRQFHQLVKYPELAVRGGFEGAAVVSVLIGDSGSIDSIKTRWATREIFEACVIRAVKNSQWEPGHIGRNTVEMWCEVPIIFSLSPEQSSNAFVIHEEDMLRRERLKRDSLGRAYSAMPPYVTYRLIVNDKEVALDSTADFGLTFQGIPLAPAKRDGNKLLFHDLPDSANAFLRAGDIDISIGFRARAWLNHGGELLFKAERRSEMIAMAVRAALSSRFTTVAIPKDTIREIQTLGVDPRSLGDHVCTEFVKYSVSAPKVQKR